MLRPGYFRASGGVARVSELIYVRMQARPLPVRGAPPEPVHMALLMMVPGDRQNGPQVRLVQDFGSSDEPARRRRVTPLSGSINKTE